MKFFVFVIIFTLYIACVTAEMHEEELNVLKVFVQDLERRDMVNSDEAIPIAIRIKDLMGSPGNLSLEQLSQLKQLKLRLPKVVQTIVWGVKTQLHTNQYPGQYIYAASRALSNNDSKRRKIYAWTGSDFGSDSYWIFSTTNRGKTFLIKNVEYDQYLFAGTITHDSSRRDVFTWRDGYDEDCYWEVEILSNNEVKLKNQKLQEHLYTSVYTKDSILRHVFTWRPKTYCDNDCTWRLNEVAS
jgi:hypothetical protein